MSDDTPPLVMHVIHHLVTGGMENGLINLINDMPRTAYRHAIACIEDYSEFRQRIQHPDVAVFALHRSKVGIARVRRELFRLCHRLRPAIVHSRNMSGLDAVLPALLAGVPSRIHGEHGWDVGDLHGERFKPALLRRLHAPFISHYVAVSRDLARYLVSRIGVGERRITHICNGVDTKHFTPAASGNNRGLLPENFRDAGLTIIGTVGRIQAVKNQRVLLEAFAAIRSQNPALREKLRLVIVGNGPLLGDLRQQARSLGIDQESWLPGDRTDISELLRGFDVFALPSLNEGISNTILEALASGLPVVASRIGGNPELIEDGATGALVTSGDVAGLANALARYVTQPEVRKQHGEAARKLAVERFGLDAMVGQYQALYDRLTVRTH